jgi:hypothetical protein
MDPMTRQWGEELIGTIFNPHVAQRILQIPISLNVDEDFVAWHKAKSFTFSVRSAYYSEWKHQYGSRIRRNDGQGPLKTNEVWEILWKLKIPAKVNIFVCARCMG